MQSRKIFVFIFAIAVLGLLAFMIIKAKAGEHKLLKDGTRQTVRIINKYQESIGNRDPRYKMDVVFFTEGERYKVFNEKDTSEMTEFQKRSQKILQENLGHIGFNQIGDFESITIDFVNDDSYRLLNKGDTTT